MCPTICCRKCLWNRWMICLCWVGIYSRAISCQVDIGLTLHCSLPSLCHTHFSCLWCLINHTMPNRHIRKQWRCLCWIINHFTIGISNRNWCCAIEWICLLCRSIAIDWAVLYNIIDNCLRSVGCILWKTSHIRSPAHSTWYGCVFHKLHRRIGTHKFWIAWIRSIVHIHSWHRKI